MIKILLLASVSVIAIPVHTQNQALDSIKTPKVDTSALLPIRVSEALEISALLKRSSKAQLPPVRDVKQGYSDGRTSYSFEDSDGTQFYIDAVSTDVDIDYRLIANSDTEALRRARISLPESKLVERATYFKDKFYPTPKALSLKKMEIPIVPVANTVAEGHGNGPSGGPAVNYDEASFSFQETVDGVKTLNRCLVRLRRDTAEITAYNARYRHTEVQVRPTISRDDALDIARWSLTQGEPLSYQILLFSEATKEQRKQKRFIYGDQDFTLEMEEDPWFAQRLLWKFFFNAGEAWVNAHTGEVVYSELRPLNPADTDYALFQLPKPVKVPQPQKVFVAPPPLDAAQVKFGNWNVTEGLYNLYYPPIIRDNSALIFSEYFPKFLISVAQKGDVITLQGGLKDKGKSATLKIGDKKATVDGNEVVLASAPVVIDKRLYLPAELMQSVNGIPIRWEAKNKLLYVETRYLRR